jgi:hypothetical protein
VLLAAAVTLASLCVCRGNFAFPDFKAVDSLDLQARAAAPPPLNFKFNLSMGCRVS